MKKVIVFIFGVALFSSCLNNDEFSNYEYAFFKIEEAITPTSFTFGEIDTIKVKYSFPNGCYSFDRIYYETKDTTRIVAVTALVSLESNCTLAIIDGEYKIPVKASQKEDYVFKFYKGKDSNGENIFEEVVIPVN